MQALKITKKTSSKVELASLVIKVYNVLSNISISDTDVEILSYMMVYGFNKRTKKLILSSKILNSSNSLENAMTRLRKVGLIVRDRDGYNIPCNGINIDPKQNAGMIIKLENV
jgi:predicted transcriptional regulator